MEEHKSMGSALVDVFDAAVVLVKSEINGVTKKVTEIAKAKGIGVVLLLGAVGPLLLGLIFLILFVFYGLMRLGLGAWAAALLIGIVSLALAGALAMMGLRKLSAEVDTDLPRRAVPVGNAAPSGISGAVATSNVAGTAANHPGAVPLSSIRYQVNSAGAGQPVSGGTSDLGNRAGASSTDAANARGASYTGAQASGYETLSTEEGSTTVPVYESKDNGEAQAYGSGLNKKIEGHDDHDDPNLQNPVTLRGAPGIPVSTDPTFREDMKKEGY